MPVASCRRPPIDPAWKRALARLRVDWPTYLMLALVGGLALWGVLVLAWYLGHFLADVAHFKDFGGR